MSKTSTTANTKELEDKFANLIGPKDEKLDREVRETLITARVGLLIRASFFGNLATRLKLINADEWCATAATDGRNFYYNTRFIKMLKPKEVEFLFGHEVLHCCYDHFGRKGDRIHQLWNVANDYCVNSDLKKHRIGEFITSVPCLYDAKYDGMCSEEIYEELYENAEKIDIQDLINQLLDDHMEGDKDGEGDGKGKDGDSKDGKGRPQLTEEEKRQIRDEIKEAMLAAAQASDPGHIPAGIKRMIKDLTEPKMNWREMLRMQLESVIKSDYTWARPSRKAWHMDAILPGLKNQDAIDIAVAIDMSGSISEAQGKDFLSEVKGIMESFDSYNITVYSFDTDYYNPQVYTSDNLDEISEYELKGGGGTDFDAIFKFLKDENVEPKRLVVFTDLMPFGSWGDPNYCDTLWVAHGNPGAEAPFGTTVHYDENV